MITGDTRRCALAVARGVGIDDENVLAEVVPGEKSAKISSLQRDGTVRVAMVGDGINDAPALAQADLGIAVGCGSDVAIETADAVLVKDDLRDVVISLHLSRAVFNRIRLNFVWALGFNILGIPLAAGGKLAPSVPHGFGDRPNRSSVLPQRSSRGWRCGCRRRQRGWRWPAPRWQWSAPRCYCAGTRRLGSQTVLRPNGRNLKFERVYWIVSVKSLRMCASGFRSPSTPVSSA